MSKTLEEMASEFIDTHFEGSERAKRIVKADLLSALRAVERQTAERERERTCEWVLDSDPVIQFYNTGCGVNVTMPYGTYCAHCRGKIVCKEKAN